MNTNITSTNLSSDQEFNVFENSIIIGMSGTRGEIILTSTEDSSETLSLYLAGYLLPEVLANCDLEASAFSLLGIQALEGRVGECSITAAEEPVQATLVMISNTGEKIDLVSNSIQLGAMENGSFEVNVTDWTPDAGVLDVEILVIDSYGRILDADKLTTVARSSGWNIGISSFTVNDESELEISILRSGYQRLEDVTCRIELESIDSAWSATQIVDVVTPDYTPTFVIKGTDGISDSDDGVVEYRLEATLSCDSPYDIDDDSEDNSATARFTPKSATLVGQSDVLISLVVASILLVIAFFAGTFTPSSTNNVNQKKKPVKPMPEVADKVSEQIGDAEEDEEDEFSFVFEEEPKETVVEEKVVEVPVEEVIIDIDEEVDSSASGRLAALRNEMDEDETKNLTREERMNRFFADK
tara:strand:- start:130 stop:1371 length:1242 start_codon:yes stop_codon:yes gene_type:complete